MSCRRGRPRRMGSGCWRHLGVRSVPMLPVVRIAPLSVEGGDGSADAAVMLIEAMAARGVDVAELRAQGELLDRVLATAGGLPLAIELTADHIARFGLGFAPSGQCRWTPSSAAASSARLRCSVPTISACFDDSA
jgi:hypothetical protein